MFIDQLLKGYFGIEKEVPSFKAHSDDPFLRLRFLVPKTGSRRSDGPISRFRFCDENVGKLFVVCSHDPFFRTNKESSIWHQNYHVKFVGAFHLLRRVSDENRACSISIRFFKITDPFDGRSFLMCSNDPFFGTNKNRNLKNGSCEQAFNRCIHSVICRKHDADFLQSLPSVDANFSQSLPSVNGLIVAIFV